MMTRTRRILLVEDTPDDVELTKRAFARSGLPHQIDVAQDGMLALDYLFAANAVLPDVVLLDLKLPRLDGVGVLRRIRADERTRRLPVIILTSSKEERDLASTYDLGANSFVRKPVDFAEFTEAARQIGVYWLFLNEAPPPVRGTSQ
jgi:two-component system response regulator